MKRWSINLLMALLMVACLAVSGCGGEKAQETSSTPPAAEEKGSLDELQKIMETSKEVTDLSFDIVSTCTSADQTITVESKYWISGEKMRMETETDGMKTITIVNAEGEALIYNPAEKTAMKISEIETPSDMPNEWSDEDDLEDYTIVGHEKMDGYNCIVVSINGVEGASTKMWLMEDNGMPVRMEATTDEGSTVIQYKNYNLEKQPADLFEIPADVQVMDMSVLPDMSQLPNMPTQ
jgi:outer membrane lipoprotein-sorting protein